MTYAENKARKRTRNIGAAISIVAGLQVLWSSPAKHFENIIIGIGKVARVQSSTIRTAEYHCEYKAGDVMRLVQQIASTLRRRADDLEREMRDAAMYSASTDDKYGWNDIGDRMASAAHTLVQNEPAYDAISLVQRAAELSAARAELDRVQAMVA